MIEENNIDKIFRTAATGFSAPTPSGAWERMESALAAKRRRRIIFWWLFSIVMVTLITFSGLFWLSDSTSKNHIVEKEQPQKHPASIPASNKKFTERSEPKAEGSIKSKKGIGTSQITKSQKQDRIPQKKLKQTSEDNTGNSGNISVESQIEEITNESAADSSNVESPKVIADKTGDVTTVSESPENHPTNSNPVIDSTVASVETNIQTYDNKASAIDSVSSVDTIQNKVIVKPPFKPEFFFAVSLGFGYTGAFIQQPDLIYKTTASTTNASSESAVNTGFHFAVSIAPKWMIYGNLQSYKMKSTGDLVFPDHNLKYININNFGYTPAGYYDADFVDYTINSKSLGNIDYLRNFEHATTSIKSNTFTLGAGRYGQWKRWTYIYRGGLSLAGLSSSKVYYGDRKTESVFGEIKGIRKNIFGLSAGGDLIYSFNNHTTLGIKMDANFFFTSVNTSKEFGYYPWSIFIGPQFGLKF